VNDVSPHESTKRAEELISQIDDIAREIERRGELAAHHLRNAAAKRDGNSVAVQRAGRRYVVRVLGAQRATKQ
jgi:hypothetical protein